MKRQLEPISDAEREKRSRIEEICRLFLQAFKEAINRPSTSKTLSDGEKRARNAEYSRRYRIRQKEKITNDSNETTMVSDAEHKRRVQNAEKCRRYRLRQKERKVFVTDGEQPTTSTTTSGIELENRVPNAEKCRQYRLRQKEKMATVPVHEQMETDHDRQHNERMDTDSEIDDDDATAVFKRNVIDNPLGHACDVCDRIWFLSDLKDVPQKK